MLASNVSREESRRVIDVLLNTTVESNFLGDWFLLVVF